MSGRHVVLIGGAATKLDHPAPARDLYTSQLFHSARAWAELEGDAWYILSALHGLVTPAMVLDPYEMHMRELDTVGRGLWGRRVADQLQEVEPHTRWHPVTILAGRLYVEPLQAIFGGGAFELPLQGLGIGQRLAWFKRELAR